MKRLAPLGFVGLAISLILSLALLAAASTLSGSNVRVTTSDIITSDAYAASGRGPADVLQQNEPHVAVSPLGADLVAVGVNDVRTLGLSGDAWQGLHIST